MDSSRVMQLLRSELERVPRWMKFSWITLVGDDS